MNCRAAQNRLPGYLDGAIRPGERAHVRKHLDSCPECREQLESYRKLAVCLAQIDPVPVPADLAVRIRVQASQSQPSGTRIQHMWQRAVLVFENILEPLAVPATGGILTAIVVFVLVVQGVLGGMPRGAVANDQPLNLVQPARLESLAPFPVPGIAAAEGQPDSSPLLLEATLNAHGEVVTYKILSGPNDTDAHHQLDQLLMFSRFRPFVSFGLPMDGGRVMLSFSQVRVRG